MYIQLERLTKAYNGRIVFRDLSWRIEPGEVHVVTGPNGAGKTTLLRIICGLLRPTEGEVRFETGGEAVEPAARGRYVGLVSPDVNPYDRLTAVENLAFFTALRGLFRSRAELRRTLAAVQLDGHEDRMAATFSTGMRQRLRLALALLHAPSVLVMDEPAYNLDAAGRALVNEIVRARCREGIVIIATNEPGEVQTYGERVLRLDGAVGRAGP